MSETHRRCGTCKEEKLNEEFYFSESKKLYSSDCKECARKRTREAKASKKESIATNTGTCMAYADGEPLIAEWLGKRFE